jgi:dihydroorotase
MSYTPDILIKHVKPVSNSNESDSFVDLRIKNGTITEIGENLEESTGEELFDAKNAYVSPGWMDMHVHFREPGYEHKETIETGSKAAVFGGFTEVACMPNTAPPIHTRDVVEFIKKKVFQPACRGSPDWLCYQRP